MDDENDRFIVALIGAEKNGAPIRRNQAAMLSNPVAVDGKVSSNLNIRHSVIWLSALWLFAMLLMNGAP